MAVVASNFKDHKFEENNSETLLSQGFLIGNKYELTKRMSVGVGPKKLRRDLNAGKQGVMKGIANDMPVISFTAMLNETEYQVDVAIKPDNLCVANELSENDKAADPDKLEKIAGHNYLNLEGEPSVISDWPKKLPLLDKDSIFKSLHSKVPQVEKCFTPVCLYRSN